MSAVRCALNYGMIHPEGSCGCFRGEGPKPCWPDLPPPGVSDQTSVETA